jgi:hypothetical protein
MGAATVPMEEATVPMEAATLPMKAATVPMEGGGNFRSTVCGLRFLFTGFLRGERKDKYLWAEEED